MQFRDVLLSRRSIRRFTSEPVPRGTIEEIVRDASHAPSWVNAQEWRVYAASGKALEKIREDFAARAAAGIPGRSDMPAAHRTQWSGKAQRHMAGFGEALYKLGAADDMAACQDVLFDAPWALILTLPQNASGWAVLDLGGFEQSILLCATDRGLGSIPAYAFAMYPDIMRKNLNIPESESVVVGIGIGHAADKLINTLRTTREENLSEVLTVRE